MGAFLLLLTLAGCAVTYILYKMRMHSFDHEALESPYRDKKIFRDLNVSKSRNKALTIALIAFIILSLLPRHKMPENEDYRPPEPYLKDTISPAEQSPDKNSTFHGSKRVKCKPLNTGDPKF